MKITQYVQIILRQLDALKSLIDTAPNASCKQQTEASLNGLMQKLPYATAMLKNDPTGDISASLEDSLLQSIRSLEAVKLAFAKCELLSYRAWEHPSARVVFVYVELPGLELSNWGCALGSLLSSSVQEALKNDSLLLFQDMPAVGLGHRNFMYWATYVNDLEKALPIVKKQLESSLLLPFAHIAIKDIGDDVVRTFLVSGKIRPFEECAAHVLEILRNISGGAMP